MVLVVVAGIIAEMAGALGPMLGVMRCYAGPFGKSDRAFAFGLLAVLLGRASLRGCGARSISRPCCCSPALTMLNRARAIVGEAKANPKAKTP